MAANMSLNMSRRRKPRWDDPPKYEPLSREQLPGLMEDFRGRFTTATIALSGIPSTVKVSGILEPSRGTSNLGDWYLAKVSSDDGDEHLSDEDEYLSIDLRLEQYESLTCDRGRWTLRAIMPTGFLTLDVQPPDPDD